MSFDVDLSTVSSEDDFGGAGLPAPGMYHVQVAKVDDSMTERDAVIFWLLVLAGTVADQRGKRLRENYYTSAKAIPRLNHAAIVMGLAKPGEKTSVNFQDAVGKTFIAEVVEESYTNKDGEEKTSVSLSYAGMWSCENLKVKDVPRGEPFDINAESGGEDADGDQWDF